jgi:hypothetical protein
MKSLDCFPMLFAFEYCCCMLRWLWIFCSLWQEILPSQLILPIANDLNPYLMFLNLFQRAKGSTSVVAPVQTCTKVTNSTSSLFLIANDLNPYLLFMYLFQRAKGSTSEVAPIQTCSKVTNLTPPCFRLRMISTHTSCSCTCFSGSKDQHLKSLMFRHAPR